MLLLNAALGPTSGYVIGTLDELDVSRVTGDWLQPGQPVLIWPLDKRAVRTLLGGREYMY